MTKKASKDGAPGTDLLQREVPEVDPHTGTARDPELSEEGRRVSNCPLFQDM